MRQIRQIFWTMVAVLLTTQTSGAQTTRPAEGGVATTQPAARSQDAGQPDEAVVEKVTGRVRYARTRDDGSLGEWQPAKAGDRLPGGTRIQTFFRSEIILKFTDDTVIVVESGTSASIDEFRRTADTKKVKLGIAHGAIRGASAETTLRSDLTIESPTATLSKRGTIGFRLEYEPVKGHFVISLQKEGLVEALNKLTHESQLIRPGQYVTQRMLRWIETAVFDDYVPVIGVFGMTDADERFAASYADGVAVVEPSGGWDTRRVIGLDRSSLFRDLIRAQRATEIRPVVPIDVDPGTPTTGRPEGNFGTGGGR